MTAGEKKKTQPKICTGIKIQYSIKGYDKLQHYNLIFDKDSLGKLLGTVKAPNTIFFFTTGKFTRLSEFHLKQVKGVRKSYLKPIHISQIFRNETMIQL